MSATPYGQLDNWRDGASLGETRGRERAASLELRGRAAEQIEIRAAYLDLLDVAPGERVLEVGCGSGAVLRDLARRVAPAGRAVGVDPSPMMLQIASELASEAGLNELVDLREGDARSLPFPDGEFDVVLAVTTLSHVPDGERAVPELRRVTRPGGRVGVFDGDGDSMMISHPDRLLTRRIVAARSDHQFANSWLARRLPGLLREAGLHDIRLRAFTAFDHDLKGWSGIQAGRAAAIAVESGAISEDERQRWLEQLRVEEAAGRFTGGLTWLFVWGTVP
ncbi:MAG TPA: methyltransferase domain-containing protein [Chloroflexota bacterium]|nr:methyltransferase domain-containing protein [Chloroflexota bacterium]